MARCCPLIRLKLQVRKKTFNKGCTHREQIPRKARKIQRDMHVLSNWTWWLCKYIVYRHKQHTTVASGNQKPTANYPLDIRELMFWELAIPVFHKTLWTRMFGRNWMKFNKREDWVPFHSSFQVPHVAQKEFLHPPRSTKTNSSAQVPGTEKGLRQPLMYSALRKSY
jgi:hypothetical protein